MRPLELQVEGFTCFRDAQPPLDLADLHLFAIAGPTGAGKSSLLDAMIFALYGSVPRLGQKRTTELVTQGRKQLAVRLDFELAGRRYRVSRSVHRARANSALLEELGPAGGGPVAAGRRLAEGVRSVDQWVEALLGLDYETFTRAVILPQGQFAAFLGSKPSERQEILKNLLRLHVYDRMRDLAGQQRRTLETRLESDGRRLAEDFADATPEALATAQGEAETLTGTRSTLREALDAAREQQTELARRRQLTVELETCRRDHERLAAGVEAAEAARHRLDAARRAAPLVPRLERLAELDTAAGTAETDREAARQRLDRATEHHTTSRDALEAARRASREVPELEGRRRQLAEVATLLEPLRRTLDRLDRLKGQDVDLEREAVERKTRREAIETRRTATTQELDVARQARKTLGFDATLLGRLAAQRDAAHQLVARRASLEEHGVQAEALATEQRQLVATVETRRGAVEQRAAELAKAQEGVTKVEAAVRHAEATARVAVLRRHLHPGDDCPVCEQTVETPPEPGDLDAVDRAQAKLEPARKGLEAARGAHGQAQSALATAEREAELVGQRLEKAHAQAVDLARTVGDLAASLQAEVGEGLGSVDTLTPDDERPIEARLLDRLQALEGQQEAHAQATERCERLEKTLAEVDRDEERLRDQATQAEQRRAEVKAERATAWEEATGYGRRVVELGFGMLIPDELQEAVSRPSQTRAASAVAEEPAGGGQLGLAFGADATTPEVGGEALGVLDAATFDPIAEGERLAEQVVALEGAERAAADAAAEAVAEQRSAEERWTQAQATADRLAEERDGVRQRLVSALAEAGFDDAAMARDAALETAEQERLAARVEEHGRESHRVERRLVELEEALGGKPVDAETLAVSAARLETLETEERTLTERLAGLEGALKTLEQRVERRATLEKELDAHHETLGLVHQLSQDLRNTHFQAYLLEKSFHDLVAGASVRLLELSQQRYELAYDNRQFQVVDHDNASQQRSTDTLSGGETFLASLALALELSEQVQHEAGAITLDSLFIDEGFGTLDPETLDIVASAIEALPQGGRRVGIITHLPDLTRRLPHRIQVEKTPAGSRWRIEEG